MPNLIAQVGEDVEFDAEAIWDNPSPKYIENLKRVRDSAQRRTCEKSTGFFHTSHWTIKGGDLTNRQQQ